MKTYKIKYNASGNILLLELKANDLKEALYLFYMSYPNYDVIEIEEI